MAVNPNSTNANATTSYFSPSSGGGGTGSFNILNTSTINFVSPVGGSLTTYPVLQSGPGGLIAGSSNNLEAFTCEGVWFGQGNYTSGQYRQSSWQQTGLTTQGNSSGTTYTNVIAFNSQLAGNTNDTLSYYRVSTIGVASGTNASGQQINMVALASTLKSVYPSIVL